MYEQEIDILNKLYVKLSVNGWKRGSNKRLSGKCPRCLLETLDLIINESDWDQKVIKANNNVEDLMRDFIASEDPSGKFGMVPGDNSSASIIVWNDYKHRNINHVFKLIDKCLSYYLSELSRNDTN
ncbi:MAG TPA: hypothetical protein VKR58_02655 [Aquella sp.]|nr:hypothetical protein [Aquella sp.]